MITPAAAATIEANQDLGMRIADEPDVVWIREATNPKGKPFGAVVSHLYQENGDAPVQVHQVSVTYSDSPEARDVPPQNLVRRTVSSDGQVTLDPGLRCECGWVGYVRLGAWVPRGNVGEIIPEA